MKWFTELIFCRPKGVLSPWQWTEFCQSFQSTGACICPW